MPSRFLSCKFFNINIACSQRNSKKKKKKVSQLVLGIMVHNTFMKNDGTRSKSTGHNGFQKKFWPFQKHTQL